MSYTCSEVIEDDEKFNTTLEVVTSNEGKAIQLIKEEPIITSD